MLVNLHSLCLHLFWILPVKVMKLTHLEQISCKHLLVLVLYLIICHPYVAGLISMPDLILQFEKSCRDVFESMRCFYLSLSLILHANFFIMLNAYSESLMTRSYTIVMHNCLLLNIVVLDTMFTDLWWRKSHGNYKDGNEIERNYNLQLLDSYRLRTSGMS